MPPYKPQAKGAMYTYFSLLDLGISAVMWMLRENQWEGSGEGSKLLHCNIHVHRGTRL